MKLHIKKKCMLLCIAAVVFVALVIWISWGNTALELNEYTVCSAKLPESFDGFRIAHISDLHNAELGEDNEKLLTLLKDAKPDMIAITGDLIDSRNTDMETALQFIRGAVTIAPCYYVSGNHEARIAAYDQLKVDMVLASVVVLEDMQTQIRMNGEYITLLGVNDPSFQTDYLIGDEKVTMESNLAHLCEKADGFTILLSHRPELFETYVAYGIDLVLSGHAHGGQFRLPYIGGLYVPNQGLFPKYDAGLYADGNTKMLVSRGIGNSLLPFRINNRPEVLLIELQSEK